MEHILNVTLGSCIETHEFTVEKTDTGANRICDYTYYSFDTEAGEWDIVNFPLENVDKIVLDTILLYSEYYYNENEIFFSTKDFEKILDVVTGGEYDRIFVY